MSSLFPDLIVLLHWRGKWDFFERMKEAKTGFPKHLGAS